MKEAKKAFHEQVAENLIEQLKRRCTLAKAWEPGDLLAVLPVNPTTGKRYRGINSLNLMSRAYTDPRWLTYKQAISLGAQVRKGEKARSCNTGNSPMNASKPMTTIILYSILRASPLKNRSGLNAPECFMLPYLMRSRWIICLNSI